MTEIPKHPTHAGIEKKSPIRRFFLILSLAPPLAILAIGVLILRTPFLLADKPSFVRYSIGGLFIAYSLFRIYQVVLKSRTDS